MKQNIEVLNIIVAAFRLFVEIFFGFSAEAVCADRDSNKEGDSK